MINIESEYSVGEIVCLYRGTSEQTPGEIVVIGTAMSILGPMTCFIDGKTGKQVSDSFDDSPYFVIRQKRHGGKCGIFPHFHVSKIQDGEVIEEKPRVSTFSK